MELQAHPPLFLSSEDEKDTFMEWSKNLSSFSPIMLEIHWGQMVKSWGIVS
jgi:hypothetical protein